MKILQAYIEQLLEFESMEAFDRWWKHKLEISGTHMEMISADVMNDGTAIVKMLSVISETELEDGSYIVEIRMSYPCMNSKSWHC